MREQMKAMLDADEARIRADERARCAGMLKFRGFDQAASMVRSDLRCDVPDPIAEAQAKAFAEAASEARRREEFVRRRASRCVLGGAAAGEHLEAARSLKCIAQWLEKKAAAIRAAGGTK